MLAQALKWLTASDTPKVVTVRNDEKMLYAMTKAKRSGAHAKQFSSCLLVYLHNPKEQLRAQLQERSEADAVEYTIKSYDRFRERPVLPAR